MKNKLIIAVIIILALAIIGITYYVKNVMIVRDKDGMVFDSKKQIAVMDEINEKGDDS